MSDTDEWVKLPTGRIKENDLEKKISAALITTELLLHLRYSLPVRLWDMLSLSERGLELNLLQIQSKHFSGYGLNST